MNEIKLAHSVPTIKPGPDAEAQFKAKAEEGGWTVHRAGWPDFMVTSPEGALAVEVKSHDDRLGVRQVAMFQALELAGVSVKVWWESEPGHLIPWKEFDLKCREIDGVRRERAEPFDQIRHERAETQRLLEQWGCG